MHDPRSSYGARSKANSVTHLLVSPDTSRVDASVVSTSQSGPPTGRLPDVYESEAVLRGWIGYACGSLDGRMCRFQYCKPIGRNYDDSIYRHPLQFIFRLGSGYADGNAHPDSEQWQCPASSVGCHRHLQHSEAARMADLRRMRERWRRRSGSGLQPDARLGFPEPERKFD